MLFKAAFDAAAILPHPRSIIASLRLTQVRGPSIRSNHLEAGAAQVAAPGRILMAFKHVALLGGIAALLLK